jgi:pimeloyl-ACP methyl ester carboxylesterase
VIAPDLRGFGASGSGEGPVTMEQFADDLEAILFVLGVVGQVTLVGLSMGGYIAWQFLPKYRHRLRALVLCDTRAAADSPAAAENRRKMAETIEAEGTDALARAMFPKLLAKQTIETRPDLVEGLRQVMLHADPKGVAAAQRGMAARPDSTERLASIDVPTLVVVGEEDQITPVDEMRQLAKAIPASQFAVVSRAGHMSPLENPTEFNSILMEFLRRS